MHTRWKTCCSAGAAPSKLHMLPVSCMHQAPLALTQTSLSAWLNWWLTEWVNVPFQLSSCCWTSEVPSPGQLWLVVWQCCGWFLQMKASSNSSQLTATCLPWRFLDTCSTTCASPLTHGVLASPLSCGLLIPLLVSLEDVCNLRHQRIIRVGVSEQRANGQQDLQASACSSWSLVIWPCHSVAMHPPVTMMASTCRVPHHDLWFHMKYLIISLSRNEIDF